MPILTDKVNSAENAENADKPRRSKYGILIRIIAGLLAAVMIFEVVVYTRTAVTVDPQQKENKAARLAARQLLANNDYANASRLERMTAYTRNLLSTKNSSASYLRAADIEIAEGNYEEAAALTAKAIEENKGLSDWDEAQLYFQMGYLLVMEEEYEDAMKWLNLGLDVKDSPEARMVRAQVWLNLEHPDMDAALEDVVAYMEAAEDTGENLADLINVYEAADEFGTAALMYTRLIEKDPKADYFLHRAYCYVRMAEANEDPEQIADAEADRDSYEKAGGRDAATADVMLGIGWMRIEDYALAGKRFIAALNEGYADPESLYYYIVLCSYCSEDFRQACTYGDQLIDRIVRGEEGTAAEMSLVNTTGKLDVKLVNLDFAFLCQMTGTSYMKIGNFSQAIQCLTMCLSEDTDRAEARYYRGVSLMVEKRYQEAEEDFTRAIAGDKEPENSHYSRAICRIKLENTAGAMEDLTWIQEYGTNEELVGTASEMMAQLMAGEIPVIDEE